MDDFYFFQKKYSTFALKSKNKNYGKNRKTIRRRYD